MLIEPESQLYIYPIPRDLGFAPNPFHGICTLATCKPHIRGKAKLGDWVMGLAGANIKSIKHHCIFLMKVTEIVTFDEYWSDPRFEVKKSIRNGSKVRVLGDNIYHKDKNGNWVQEDSHHSNADGSYNLENLKTDTGTTENVLISTCFRYFGSEAEFVDLQKLDYGRIRNYRKISFDNNIYAKDIISHFFSARNEVNLVSSDPCHFDLYDQRVDQKSGQYYS